jgi:hypothetical protein
VMTIVCCERGLLRNFGSHGHALPFDGMGA